MLAITPSYQNNKPSFGHAFFLKDVPVNCAYCGKKMLSISNIRKMAEKFEERKGDRAVAILRNHYNSLDNRQKVVIDVLSEEILRRPKEPVKEVILGLAKKFGRSTDAKYEEAVDTAFAQSGISPQSKLAEKLSNLIEQAKKPMIPNQGEHQAKPLRITYLQNGLTNLIQGSRDPSDVRKLKHFISAINGEFNYIKQDPCTFFPKFGYDKTSSLFGSLFAPIRSTADHIVTASRNGLSAEANYIASCGRCNWGRGERPFKSFVSSKPQIIPNIKQQFVHLDSIFGEASTKPDPKSRNLSENIYNYLLNVQKTIAEELGNPLQVELPNFKKRVFNIFGWNQ